MEIGSDLIVAVGGAALLAALAFRYLVDTVLKLNRDFQELFEKYHESENARQELLDKVASLEAHVTLLERQLEEQSNEIRKLRMQLGSRDELIEQLKNQQPIIISDSE